MTTETPTRDSILQPAPAEHDLLERLRSHLGEISAAKGEASARLVGPDGVEVSIPASAFHALELVADGMARGLTMLLMPQGKELTTQQAADLLHVSRPHVVKLLEAGMIPFHNVGTHRRIKIEDVLAYRSQRNQRRSEALDEITRLSEESAGGYE